MKIIMQVLFFLGLNLIGNLIHQWTHIPLPGSIIGMFLLVILLFSGLLKEEKIRETSDFLLNNMGFFLLPAGIKIMGSYQILKGSYWTSALVIICSTLVIIIVTSIVAQIIISIREKLKQKQA